MQQQSGVAIKVAHDAQRESGVGDVLHIEQRNVRVLLS